MLLICSFLEVIKWLHGQRNARRQVIDLMLQ